MSGKFRRRYKRLTIQRDRARKLYRLRVPTFLEGMASVSDWTGELGPSLRDLYGEFLPEQLDANAIATDWEVIGSDLYDVLHDFERRKLLRLETVSE